MDRPPSGGTINIGPIWGLVAHWRIRGRSYETSKAGGLQVTRATAVDRAPHRVTVNAIAPDAFLTAPNLRGAGRARGHGDVPGRTPMREGGPPEDQGPLAVYLASDATNASPS